MSKYRQILELKQGLKLTPQQLQFVRMLELNTLEFEEFVQHELEDNPAIEESFSESENNESDVEETSDPDFEDPYAMENYLDESDYDDFLPSDRADFGNDRNSFVMAAESASLRDYLVEQMGEQSLSEQDTQIAQYIIGNINDDGYLERDLNSLSDDLLFQVSIDVDVEYLERLLKIIQEFDPPGVGARSLQECLAIQIEKTPQSADQELAKDILNNEFDAFSHKNYARIIQNLAINESQLLKVIELILTLNPKPGAAWSDNDSISANSGITPDFILESEEDELILTLNTGNIPSLRLSRSYQDLLQATSTKSSNPSKEIKEAAQYVKQKVDSARWFIDCVRQRQETLISIMKAIIHLQHDYLLDGQVTSLRPMILKDVAEITGYDLSTISRVTTSKYVQTNFGIYSLRHFFSDSFQTESGEEISVREVKKSLKEIIDNEDKRKPMQDEQLSLLLKEKGYAIARRTVVKYREQMGIPTARLRREL